MTTEQWRDVAGYEGIYRVSDLGRVRRIKGGTGTRVGLILKQRLRGTVTQYPSVMLYNGSSDTRKQFFVHVLVAQAFLGPKPKGYEINHKNGDKADARAENLEYVTKSGNRIHAMTVLKVGPNNTGSRNGMAILDECDVLKIRYLYATGQLYLRELADKFGVSRTVITNIINFRTWKHVGGPRSTVTYRPLKPIRPGNAKLDPDKVREIRRLAAEGQGRNQIARMFNVTGTAIGLVLRRQVWADVD